MHLRQIGECDALQGFRKDLTIRYWLFQHGQQSLDGIAPSARGGQGLGKIAEQV